MSEDPWLATPPTSRTSEVSPNRAKRRMTVVGLLAAGAVAGGILAGSLGASAATSSSSTSSTASTSAESGGRPANAHSSTPVRSDEKAVSSTITATLTQKALAKFPGGKVYRVETDAGDAAYEAHMTKADGTEVTVKFDKNLNVTGTETGMGKGDPGMRGPGDHDGDGPRGAGGTGGVPGYQG